MRESVNMCCETQISAVFQHEELMLENSLICL